MDMKDMILSIKESGFNIDQIQILGGPTRSDVWNQIQSDIYGLPVSTLKVPDAALVGAAIMAGYGAGLFSSIEEGADKLVKIDKRYEPNAEASGKYQQMYGIYQKAFTSLSDGDVFSSIATFQQQQEKEY